MSPSVPDGDTVTLEDSSTSGGPYTVLDTTTTAGSAFSFSESGLPVGTSYLVAVYGGDGDFQGSTSNEVAQVVKQPTTTSLIDNGPNPSAFGGAVSFSGTVSPSVPDGDTVMLEDSLSSGGPYTVLDTTTTSGSAFSFSESGLPVGTSYLVAVYGGDGNFQGSISNEVAQVVKQPTTTSLTDNGPNPSAFGGAVSFSGTVSPSVPDGDTVTLEDSLTSGGPYTVLDTTTTTGSAFSFSESGLPVGTSYLVAVYGGDGNFQGSTSDEVTQVVNQAATTTSLTDNGPNPSAFGGAVSFSGTVSPSVPDGDTVTLEDSSTSGGPYTVLDTTTTAGSAFSFSESGLPVGTSYLVAVYGGDGNFQGSTSSEVTQVVNQAATTTSLTDNGPNPSAFGGAVSFSGTVSPSVPDGDTVTLEDSLSSGGPYTVLDTTTTAGSAFSFSESGLPVGTSYLVAVYGGDGDFQGSASAEVTQVVNQAATTTSLTDNGPNPSAFGGAVSFSGTVSPSVPDGDTVTLEGSATSGGLYTVLDTTTTAGSAFSFSESGLPVGTSYLVAVYGGDGNFQGSTSNEVAQVVNQAATTTSLIDNGPNPSAFGGAVSFSGTVSPSVPDGDTVTLEDSATSGGPYTVLDTTTTAGSAFSFSESGLPVGTSYLVAVYGGDGNFQGSISNEVAQVVKQPTTTSLTDNGPNPSAFGGAVSFSGTVSPSVPDGDTVTLEDSSTSGGPYTVLDTTTTAGSAFSFSESGLPVGTSYLVAVYGGDGDFQGSTSNEMAQVVNQAATTTSLTDNGPNPSAFGGAVSFTGTVSPSVPDGDTVTLEDSATSGGPYTVLDTTTTAGSAFSFSESGLPVGTSYLVAVYGGDGDFQGSTSNEMAQVVNQAATTTSLTDNGPNPSAFGGAVSFTGTVSPSVPDGDTVTLEDSATSGGPYTVLDTTTTAGMRLLLQ